jgi:Cu-processing system ATP-binding protein
VIEFKDINKRFGRLQVLKNVNLSLAGGQGTAIIGPNGSGKTTLLKCLLGLTIQDSGTIEIDGKAVARDWNYRKDIGYMSQISRFPENLSIGELLKMVRDIRTDCKDYDEELIETFRLEAMSAKKLGTLSGGTRQKVSAALAFLFKPSVLILDEPTAGLDPLATEHIKEKILKEKKNGKLIIITSHIMVDIEELADTLLYIIDGKVQFHWPVAQVKQHTDEQSFSKALAKITKDYGNR